MRPRTRSFNDWWSVRLCRQTKHSTGRLLLLSAVRRRLSTLSGSLRLCVLFDMNRTGYWIHRTSCRNNYIRFRGPIFRSLFICVVRRQREPVRARTYIRCTALAAHREGQRHRARDRAIVIARAGEKMRPRLRDSTMYIVEYLSHARKESAV